jgi:hypothetical protein
MIFGEDSLSCGLEQAKSREVTFSETTHGCQPFRKIGIG